MTAPATAAATLILAGSATGARGGFSPQSFLLGLPLVRRTALAARRAGFDRVYVLDAEAGAARPVLEGTGAVAFPRDAGESALPPGRIVLLPDRVAASPRWLRSLREAPVEPGCLHRVGVGAIVQASAPQALARVLAHSSSLTSVLSEWASLLPPGPAVESVDPPFEVATEADVAGAETLLLNGLVKTEDGFLTKHISRKISLAVTRRLAGTRVRPNAMTLVCLALGLAAAWSFASPAPVRQLAGGLLFLLHSILDGCDGELARLKFQESRLGAVLDFWGDNLVHVAVFSAFAVAWSTASGKSWPFALGALAVAGTIVSSGFLYRAMGIPGGAGRPGASDSPGSRSRMTRVLNAVSGRDFIYLVMVLALFGKAYWFLASAALGTPVFFAAIFLAALGSRKRAPGPGSPQSSPESARSS